MIVNRLRLSKSCLILGFKSDIKSDFNAPIQKKNFKFEQKSFKNVWKQILDKIPEVDVIYLKKQIKLDINKAKK